MDSSSVCEKNKDGSDGEKLKKHFYKTLLKISPFDMAILALKQVGDREKEQSQTREICFKLRAHLLYIPAFNIMKDFH